MPSFWIGHRRRVVLCGACALTLVAVEFAVRRLQPSLSTYDVAIYRRAQEGLRSAGPPDIVLMGSSRVRYALDPAVFEQILARKTYNAGVAGSKIVEWNVFARRLFNDFKPRLVVLGINASEVRWDYAPTEAARNLFDLDDFLESWGTDGLTVDVAGHYAQRSLGPLWKTCQSRYELLLWGQERLAPILPKHAQHARELRERVARPQPLNGYDHPWTHGRRLKNLMQWVQEDRLAVVEGKAPEHHPHAFSFTRLENLLDWFDRQGIHVLVAYIPNSPRTEERWSNVEPEMKARIAEVCRSRSVPFVHWDRAQLPRSDCDYLHETHVGWPLACEISLYIADHIRALALLDEAPPAASRQIASTEAFP